MDKDHKPQPTGDKPSDKKPAAQGGGNLVWYMVGLGVLLLLMITMLNSGSPQTMGWSDLLKLVEASGDGGAKFIDIADPSGTEGKRIRISDLSEIKIGNSYVSAKVSRQNLKATPSRDSNGEVEYSPVPDKEKNIELRVERLAEEQQLQELLRKKGLAWSIAGPPNPLLNYIPLLLMTALLVMLFVFMIRRMGGAGSPMAFGRSRGKLFAQEDIEITFEDVAGIDEAVDELREVV